MHTQQLSRVQFVMLSIWLFLGTGFLTLPFAIGQFTVRDAWIVPFLFIPQGVIVAGVITWFRQTFPGQSLVEGCHTAFGPWWGRIPSLWFLIMTLVVECFVLREVGLFLTTTVLPSTPEYVVNAMFLIPVAYAVYQGVEAVGRLGETITPIGMGITLVISVLSMQYADPSHYHPVLADGWTPILRGSIVVWMYAWLLLFVLQLGEAVPQRLGKDLLIMVLIITSAGLVAEPTICMVLGPSAAYSLYPILEVVRTIRIADFLERLDTFYVMGVVVGIFLQCSFIHYALVTGISQWTGLGHYRPAVWSGAVLAWAGSIFFIRNESMFLEYVMYVGWGYLTFTGIAVPLLAVVVHRWRQRRKV
ncbi:MULTISPECIES: GerAB/ArcD/ProY family transporter [Kyrpidia]|uniref:Spore germination protein n=1 Tax=Kyrpidia spormannii TaxID=2055160 RepID=A0ACA8Z5R6_9BACL|nr:MULTISPECIES: GerAB/ArcD/ProY family transporter [Kyrpidia]MCL6577574.1 spore germination protein [Kyrpidia sp.]CAB3389983.1 Spore germination protein [Kyrpidia spormannii]